MNLYFECNMGASGDMIASALVDLFEDKEGIVKELNSLSLPHTEIKYGRGNTGGISASHISVVVKGEEEIPDDGQQHRSAHRTLGDIYEIIDCLNAPDKVKTEAKAVYSVIAQAEAKAHGTKTGEVHFHELGMLDAIADVTMAAYLIFKLNPEKIIASPVNVGGGSIKCAHGIMPVPTPATANILVGVPYYKSDIKTELCTPTGAAIFKYYADEFTENPSFGKALKVGVGMGTKKLEMANVLRAFLYEGELGVVELSCNVDDMTGEEIGFAVERLMDCGALDCFVTPAVMKKGRPAYLLTAICRREDEEKFVKLMFRHTATLGIRKYSPSRYTLEREIREEAGIRIKRSEGFGTVKEKAEFEDIKKLAIEKDISIFEARDITKKD